MRNLCRVVATQMLTSKQQHHNSVVVDIVCFQLVNSFPWGILIPRNSGMDHAIPGNPGC